MSGPETGFERSGWVSWGTWALGGLLVLAQHAEPAAAQVVIEEDDRTPVQDGEKPPLPPEEGGADAPPPPPPGAGPAPSTAPPTAAPAAPAASKYPGTIVDLAFHMTGGGSFRIEPTGDLPASTVLPDDQNPGTALGGMARIHFTFVRYFGLGPMIRFSTQSPLQDEFFLRNTTTTNFDLSLSLLGQYPVELGGVAFDVYATVPFGLSVTAIDFADVNDNNVGFGYNVSGAVGFRFWAVPRVFGAFLELGVLHRRTLHIPATDITGFSDYSLPVTQFLFQLGIDFGLGGR